MSYGAKLVTAAVGAKAVLMSAVVTVLGATTFLQSLALVLVSATATGVFGAVIVIVQARAERALHDRMDTLGAKAADVARKAEATAQTATATIVEAVRQANGGTH